MENKNVNEKYLVETTETVSYIVDKQFLEVMLTNLLSPEDIVCLKYGTRVDWHFGEDKRIYETLSLTSEGKKRHEMINAQTQAEPCFTVLSEIGKNDNCQNSTSEQQRVFAYCKTNEICRISEYQGKEFEKPQKEQNNRAF